MKCEFYPVVKQQRQIYTLDKQFDFVKRADLPPIRSVEYDLWMHVF